MENGDLLLEQRIREKAYQLWEEAGRPQNEELRFWFLAKMQIDQQEAKLDSEISQSFPASDPPSSSVVSGAAGEAQIVADASDTDEP